MDNQLISKNKIVIYHNDLNSVSLKSFTTVETRVFMSIIMKSRNKGTSQLTFSFDELRNITEYKHTSIKSFVSTLERVYDKVLQTSIRIGDESEFSKFTVFTDYDVSTVNKELKLSIHPRFEYLINNLGQSFTLFEWKQFNSLEYQYSQRLYFELKQYRKTGYRIFTIEDFRDALGIPEEYPMHNIDKKVLTPCISELKTIFKRLRVNKIKTGRRISHIEFYFENEDDVLSDGSKVFRDKNGNFYEKHLLDFDAEEVKKTYPTSPSIAPGKTRKRVTSKKTDNKSKKSTAKKKTSTVGSDQLTFEP